jgi:hypothetical protein
MAETFSENLQYQIKRNLISPAVSVMVLGIPEKLPKVVVEAIFRHVVVQPQQCTKGVLTF